MPDAKYDKNCYQTNEGYIHVVRRALHHLDAIREEQMSVSPPGLQAQIVLLDQLSSQFVGNPGFMDIREMERLVWLLGEPAQKFPIHHRDVSFPWTYAANDPVELALKRCFDDPRNAEAKEALQAMVTARRQKLNSLREMLQGPRDEVRQARAEAAALLPDADTLNRQVRYETHAWRTLERSIGQLARFRGVDVQTVMDRLPKPVDRLDDA